MRLAFFANHERYFPLADRMISSARKAMPGIHIAQMLDSDGPKHPMADEVFRTPIGTAFGLTRMYHYVRLSGEWIFCDVDVIFQHDVWDVFDDEFDVAVAERGWTKDKWTRYTELMPYNNGIIFSRGNAFWREMILGFDDLPETAKDWGEQLLFNRLVATGRFKVKILPSLFNHTPRTQDEDISCAHILHYKGNRKAWMLSDWGT